MGTFTTKFSLGDTAYRIYRDNAISVIVSDIYVHDSLSNGGVTEISYKVSYAISEAGVGMNKPGPLLFNEHELFYLNEITPILTNILAQKVSNLQALQ